MRALNRLTGNGKSSMPLRYSEECVASQSENKKTAKTRVRWAFIPGGGSYPHARCISLLEQQHLGETVKRRAVRSWSFDNTVGILSCKTLFFVC